MEGDCDSLPRRALLTAIWLFSVVSLIYVPFCKFKPEMRRS
jgi:hypothetical protein